MSNSIQKSTWHCPKCNHNVIAEVSRDCSVHTRVLGLNQHGQLIFGEHTNVTPGRVAGYECERCGEPVRSGVERVASRDELTTLLTQTSE